MTGIKMLIQIENIKPSNVKVDLQKKCINNKTRMTTFISIEVEKHKTGDQKTNRKKINIQNEW